MKYRALKIGKSLSIWGMNKIPLMLIPGLACDRAVWKHQVENLSDVAEPIVVPDLTQQSTPAQMLEAAMEDAPERFALAGHSMGGWVALEIMKNFPERVLKLCLLSTTAEVDTPIKRQVRLSLIKETESGNFQIVIEKLLDHFVFNKAIEAEFRSMILRNENAFVNQIRALMERESTESILPAINQKTLVILGDQDIDFPDETRRIAHAIPGAQLEMIPQCGHMSPMEQPERVTALMRDWLVND